MSTPVFHTESAVPAAARGTALAGVGVHYVFTPAGEDTAALASLQVRLAVTWHEAAAVAMADDCARDGERPVAVLLAAGDPLAAAVPSPFDAVADRTPLVLTLPTRPADHALAHLTLADAAGALTYEFSPRA
ncbi:thiamine pyrophosphate-binding protein [Nonomuraea rubra]